MDQQSQVCTNAEEATYVKLRIKALVDLVLEPLTAVSPAANLAMEEAFPKTQPVASNASDVFLDRTEIAGLQP